MSDIPTLSFKNDQCADAIMAVSTETIEKTSTTIFPRKETEALLREELMGAAKEEADMNGLSIPSESSAVVIAPIPMDSLVVVDLLCALDNLLGFQPKPATVKTGGYNSVQEALDHLMPQLEKQWRKKRGEN